VSGVLAEEQVLGRTSDEGFILTEERVLNGMSDEEMVLDGFDGQEGESAGVKGEEGRYWMKFLMGMVTDRNSGA
jgi:hypothetical protein